MHSDGKVLCGVGKTLQCLDAANGQRLWGYDCGDLIIGAPCVSGGLVFVGSLDKGLHCVLAKTGKRAWKFTAPESVESSAICVDGKVYFGCSDQNLYCLEAATGKEAWKFKTLGPVQTSPAFDGGRIYTLSWGGFLFCLDASTGELLWQVDFEGKGIFAPVLSGDKLFVASTSGVLYCFEKTTGKLAYIYQASSRITCSPCVYGDYAIFGTDDAKAVCVNVNTAKRVWVQKLSSNLMSTSSTANGRLYLTSDKLYMKNIVTASNIWRYEVACDTGSSPAIAADCIFLWAQNQLICMAESPKLDLPIQSNNCQWPMFRGNPERNGVAGPGCGPNPFTMSKMWQFAAKGGVWSSPAVADGRVYVGSDDANLYCIDEATGKALWSQKLEGVVKSSPAIWESKIYVGYGGFVPPPPPGGGRPNPPQDPNKGGLACIDVAKKAVKWDFKLDQVVPCSPLVMDSKVFFGSTKLGAEIKGAFYCLEASTGIKVWSTDTSGIEASPTFASGKVWIGNTTGRMFCLEAKTGKELWTADFGSGVSTAVLDEGNLYFGNRAGRFFCVVAETGETLWSFNMSTNIQASPAVYEGMVFCGTLGGPGIPGERKPRDFTNYFYALDKRTGKPIWSMDITEGLYDSPAVASGLLYFGTHVGDIYCVDAKTGAVFWTYNKAGDLHSGPALSGGKMFAGSTNGNLYCFGNGPRLFVDPVFIDFGEIIAGRTEQATFTIGNVGENGVLSGTVAQKGQILALSATSFSLSHGHKTTIKLSVDSSQVPKGKYEVPLTVTADNGETETVLVAFEITGQPILEVSPLEVDFGQVERGKYSQSEISIRNIGEGMLRGTIKSDAPWLTVGYEAWEGNEKILALTADTTLLEPERAYEAAISFESNGGMANVLVKIWVKDPPPKLQWFPAELIFTDVDWGTKLAGSFIVTNIGGKTLEAEIATNANWVSLSPSKISIKNKKVEVAVSIDTSKLQDGATSKAQISIKSNGGNGAVLVTVSTRPKPSKLEVAPKGVLISNCLPDKNYTAMLTISNAGKGKLLGTIKIGPGTPWLSTSHPGFTVADKPLAVTVTVDTTGFLKGNSYAGKLLIDSNGGANEVGVIVVMAKPKKTTAELWIGKLEAKIDGKPKKLPAAPYLKLASTMVPLRFLAEAFGSAVSHDKKTGATVVQKGASKIMVWQGKQTAQIDGKPIKLDVAPEIKNGTLFVPIRFISEIYRADVSWDATTKKVTITYQEE